jgi:poly(beta-D-mannuronate) lyase
MKNHLSLAIALMVLAGCQLAEGPEVLVSTSSELRSAISNAGPGTEIVMANGDWTDLQIHLVGAGTEKRPITLRAETPGQVIIRGDSDLRLAGEHLLVDGLYFRDGASPSGSVIQFFVSEDSLANHSRVTNCVIDGYNKAQRNIQDLWVRFKGRHNQLDHCYLAGKSNRGPTIRVDLAGNESIYNYHRISNNHFGPRPPKGGPSAETIQIGDSGTSMAPSHTLVENNLFDRANGEVEVISSKANFNTFRGNVFYKSEGSLVTRHGNYATVDGNYFIGDGESPHYGGVRLIGTGHLVTNNYFFGLRGTEFRAPIAMMNGIRRSAINRYFQVTDVVVAHNTWVNTASPWHVGVGSNTDQEGVLPASEIRSETPVRTLFANNIIYNEQGDTSPIVRQDSIGGIDFRQNFIDNQGVRFRGVDGLVEADLSFEEIEDAVWIPSTDLSSMGVHSGFEFDRIESDLFGNPRTGVNAVGATNGTRPDASGILDRSRYGPDWFDSEGESGNGQTHSVGTGQELVDAIAQASDEDIIALAPGVYEIRSSLTVDKAITVRSEDTEQRATIRYAGDSDTPAFEMNPGGHLYLTSIDLEGTRETYAFAPLQHNMSSLYNLEVEDSEISGFAFVLKAYRHSFAEVIRFTSTSVHDCTNGLELSAEIDDRGDYNAENVFIIDSDFDRVSRNVVDYYRGGYDESTVGGNLVIQGTTFERSGADEDNGILINTYGIINVDLSGNRFKNNRVDLVARLWGAKNNRHASNVIENSGSLVVEQNLTLRLMY